MAPRFQSLRVIEARADPAGSLVVGFDTPASWRGFTPGQFLTLRATVAGHDIRRCYSICSGLDDGPLRVAIKQLAGGVFSSWAAKTLATGQTLAVAPPDGRFGIAPQPNAARVFAAFAAGSGITPILSIMKTVLAREPASRFFLFFGNRTTQDIMFRDEIEDLKDRHLRRLSVFHVLSRERQELDILNGRLDAGKIPALLRLMPEPDHVFICGPEAMISGARDALAAAGVAADRLHEERFTASPDGARGVAPVASDAVPASIATLVLDGARIEVPLRAGETIIDGALRMGRDPPFSCKAGMCCTCRARLIEGRVEMAANYSLEPWETEAGYVLACQARPLTARVVVDFDQV